MSGQEPIDPFGRRNFAVGNLETLAMYGGLGITFFLLVLFLQEVAGYRALAAGLALMPLTIVTSCSPSDWDAWRTATVRGCSWASGR